MTVGFRSIPKEIINFIVDERVIIYIIDVDFIFK